MFCRVTWERRAGVRPALMAVDETLEDVYLKPDRPDTLPFDGLELFPCLVEQKYILASRMAKEVQGSQGQWGNYL